MYQMGIGTMYQMAIGTMYQMAIGTMYQMAIHYTKSFHFKAFEYLVVLANIPSGKPT
jgi:hypothetical protein